MITEILGVIVTVVAVVAPFVAKKYKTLKHKVDEFKDVLVQVNELLTILPDEVSEVNQTIIESLIKEGKDVKEAVAKLLENEPDSE